jgi:hypothetical protein
MIGGGGGGRGGHTTRETSRRAPVRAGTHPSGRAGSSGAKSFAPCGGAKAGGIGGGCTGKEKSRRWCGREVTKEEEVLASQAQRLVVK